VFVVACDARAPERVAVLDGMVRESREECGADGAAAPVRHDAGHEKRGVSDVRALAQAAACELTVERGEHEKIVRLGARLQLVEARRALVRLHRAAHAEPRLEVGVRLACAQLDHGSGSGARSMTLTSRAA
jgi:hypothetical protein